MSVMIALPQPPGPTRLGGGEEEDLPDLIFGVTEMTVMDPEDLGDTHASRCSSDSRAHSWDKPEDTRNEFITR
jgi:hypothetical protein